MKSGVTVDRHRVALAVLSLGALAIAAGTTGASAGTCAAVVLIGGPGDRSRGMTALVAWIVGGALLGGAVGYAADVVVELPLALAGAVGLGIALGGGMGGISHLLSTEDPTSADDEQVTVDMATESATEPRPADLFEEHPDPILYVTDAGAGPVVRAANEAYEGAFDLPAATVEDAPLGDVLVPENSADGLVDRLGNGEGVDEVVAFETPAGTRRYRVRSVGASTDGYLLFSPVDE